MDSTQDKVQSIDLTSVQIIQKLPASNRCSDNHVLRYYRNAGQRSLNIIFVFITTEEIKGGFTI